VARILVIDDEPLVRRAICQMLVRGGHTTLEATDGSEGLKLAQAQMPDLVITDLLMPNKEGIETIRELRRDDPALPILVMSGNSGSSLYLQIATLLGAHAALSKPFKAAELLAAVTALLRRRGGSGAPPRDPTGGRDGATQV
jgi:DNA-binding response OmpR family regulator